MTDEVGIATEPYEGAEAIEVEPAVPSRPESAQETARAVWEELEAKANEADPDAKVAGQKVPPDPAKVTEEDKFKDISEAGRRLAGARKLKRQTFVPAESAALPADAVTEKFEPPQRWEVKDKEWFLSQPPEVQKNAIKWFKDAEGHTTKLWQDLSRETARSKEVVDVLDKHWPDLNIPSNFTKGQVVDQLLQYQKRINADSAGAIVEMMQHRKVSLQDLQARMTGQQSAPQTQVQPQQNYLTVEQARVIWQQEQESQNQSRTVHSATEEVNALGREVQGNRYIWPEMHNANAIQRIQPLITYFRETTPGLSWADYYKKAIAQDRVNRGIASPSPTSSRLSPENIQSVRQAASSLRSRGGNGAIPRMSEPSSKETARESAEAAYYEVFGDKQH